MFQNVFIVVLMLLIFVFLLISFGEPFDIQEEGFLKEFLFDDIWSLVLMSLAIFMVGKRYIDTYTED